MVQVLRKFNLGRPQLFAGLMLLFFLAQCIWVASGRRLSDLEYDYIASGFKPPTLEQSPTASPFTGLAAASALRTLSAAKKIVPTTMRDWLAIPHPVLIRLPFICFGLWLGGALWWVARRLFGDQGGYVALALYCMSPSMVNFSSNIGPEIILAWSIFGLIYTAIGMAHTIYAPPRKWIPRIAILGIAVGICLSTALWSFTIVLPALGFMIYLSPGRRKEVLVVFLVACSLGVGFLLLIGRTVGYTGLSSHAGITPRLSLELLRSMGFIFADDQPYYVLPILLGCAFMVYGAWDRSRYFGNTAPLIASYTTVLLFALVPAMHIVEVPLGLSFAFLFIGGIAADLFETSYGRKLSFVLAAILGIKSVLGMSLLRGWIHQNTR